MSCTASGKLTWSDSSGAPQPLAGQKLYALPSRTDFMWTDDGGTTWRAWQKNPNLPTAYQYGIEITTNGSGEWSVKLPWSDSELHLPVGAPAPAVLWNVVDPTTGKVYYGPLLQSVVGAAKTLDELTQLAAPNDWKIAGSAQVGLPVVGGFAGTITFTDASEEAAVAFATPASSSEYRVLHGLETDSSAAKTPYAVGVKEGSRTVDGFTLKLSQQPPSGQTVKAWFRVEVP